MDAGLRICNQVQKRKEILLCDFHQAAFQDARVRLVGFNPDMPGISPFESWEDLKTILACHRFYVHTAHPELEDGYNMATLEAMAAGLPVLGNRHPSSPIEHKVSGFLSDDPRVLNGYAKLLLRDRELAGKMGEAARKKAAEWFSLEKFARRFQGSMVRAWRNWEKGKAPEVYFSSRNSSLSPMPLNGPFGRLSRTFRNSMERGEVEKAVGVLDEMMGHLGMPRNREIGSLEDFLQITLEVKELLQAIPDCLSASNLTHGLLKLMPSG